MVFLARVGLGLVEGERAVAAELELIAQGRARVVRVSFPCPDERMAVASRRTAAPASGAENESGDRDRDTLYGHAALPGELPRYEAQQGAASALSCQATKAMGKKSWAHTGRCCPPPGSSIRLGR